MHFDYLTNNVCAQQISFDINDDIITNIQFFGGCNGNLKAISYCSKRSFSNER